MTNDSTTSEDGFLGSDPEYTDTGPVRREPTEGIADAVAAQIGDRNLWIANSKAVDPSMLETLSLSPEHVVSVNRETTPATTDHHPLRDGYINAYDEFTAAVDTTRDRMQDDGVVIVNCAAGISRSSTVIATAVAAEEDRPFRDVVAEIRETREYARPNLKLVITACRYLTEQDGRSRSLRETDAQQVAEAKPTITDEMHLDVDEEPRFAECLNCIDANTPDDF